MVEWLKKSAEVVVTAQLRKRKRGDEEERNKKAETKSSTNKTRIWATTNRTKKTRTKGPTKGGGAAGRRMTILG